MSKISKLNEQETDNLILPADVTVLGRTQEQHGGEILVAYQIGDGNRHKLYTLAELIGDNKSLAKDLAEAGHVDYVRGKPLRAVADEILRIGIAIATVVLTGNVLNR